MIRLYTAVKFVCLPWLELTLLLVLLCGILICQRIGHNTIVLIATADDGWVAQHKTVTPMALSQNGIECSRL